MAETPSKTPAKKTAAKKTAAKKTAAKAPAKKAAAVKTPAAAKKSATVKAVASPASQTRPAPTHYEVSMLAYKFWTDRGHHHGSDREDWLRAEAELNNL